MKLTKEEKISIVGVIGFVIIVFGFVPMIYTENFIYLWVILAGVIMVGSAIGIIEELKEEKLDKILYILKQEKVK